MVFGDLMKTKSINISILLNILNIFVSRTNIRPTKHFLLYHSEVEWELVVLTILSPNRTHPNKRYGRNRFTYIKKFKDFVLEVHTIADYENIWVINAFKQFKN